MLNGTNIKDFVEAFLAESDRRAKLAAGPTATGVKPTQLGKLAARDPNAVFGLRAGVEWRQKKIDAFATTIEGLMPGFADAYFADSAEAEPDTSYGHVHRTVMKKSRQRRHGVAK